jgi:hypothetical protein
MPSATLITHKIYNAKSTKQNVTPIPVALDDEMDTYELS